MKKKNAIIFVIIFIISIAIFFPLLLGNLIGDDYLISSIGYIDYIKNYSLNDGRIFCTILPIIFNALHIPIFTGKIIALMITLAIASLTVVKLKNIIDKYKKSNGIKQSILVTLISFATIYNFLFIDEIFYIEAPVIVSSILLFIIAANILVTNNKKSLIKSLLLVVIASFCYQGTILVFFAMSFLFSILKNKDDVKRVFIDLFKCICIAGIATIMNFAFIKIYGKVNNINSRAININKIKRNIAIIFENADLLLIKNFNFYYEGMFLGIVITIIVTTLIYATKNDLKNSIIIKMACIIVLFIISSSAMYVVIFSSFYAGRTRIPLGMLIGALLIFIYVETKIFEDNKTFKYFCVVVLLFYIITVLTYFEKIIISKKQSDKLNIDSANKIIEYVHEYESDTGIEVTNITELALINYSKEINKYLYKMHANLPFSDTNLINMRSASSMVNYYSDKKYENYKVEIATQYGEPASYYCKGDTLYIYICSW